MLRLLDGENGKSVKKLSPAQREFLLLLADRREEASAFKCLLNNRCQKGIIAPYARESRMLDALLRHGLVRWVYVPRYPATGVTLTQAGAEALTPPAKVTYPE